MADSHVTRYEIRHLTALLKPADVQMLQFRHGRFERGERDAYRPT